MPARTRSWAATDETADDRLPPVQPGQELHKDCLRLKIGQHRLAKGTGVPLQRGWRLSHPAPAHGAGWIAGPGGGRLVEFVSRLRSICAPRKCQSDP